MSIVHFEEAAILFFILLKYVIVNLNLGFGVWAMSSDFHLGKKVILFFLSLC